MNDKVAHKAGVPYTIAVIEPEYLTALGMKTLLESLVPFAEVLLYEDAGSFMVDAGRRRFVHCFVDGRIYFSNASCFASLPFVVILLVRGRPDGSVLAKTGLRYISLDSGRHDTLGALMRVHCEGHKEGHRVDDTGRGDGKPVLTGRETEVLRLVATGHLNKEIADRLGISITTVISHRKHITDKLHIKSVPALTVYAVLHGLVGLDRI